MIWEFGSNLSAVSRYVSPSHAAGRRKCNSGTTWKQKYGRQHREGQTILQSVQDVVPWKMHRRRNLAKLDQNTVHILLCILTPTLVRGINSRRVIYYTRTTYSLRINRVIILALTVLIYMIVLGFNQDVTRILYDCIRMLRRFS